MDKLTDLERRLPEIRTQVAHIRTNYNKGRDKVRCALSFAFI